MEEAVRNAIACITISGVEMRGTGFLVADDLVATALHVVLDKTSKPPKFFTGVIQLRFPNESITAEILDCAWDDEADCVLLRCLNPSKSRPLALRELNRSGGSWETYGFPKMQPRDGMVMDGTVKNHAAELDRRPAIQLFCNEVAAGEGGPVNGLSGAPVIMGDSVVGLMRFALKQEGKSAGGTLYACKAQALKKLCPNRLKLLRGASVVPTLTVQQESDLAGLLVSAFNSAELSKILLFSAGVKLESVVTSNHAISGIVADLLRWAEQRGPGTIDILLRGAVTARPRDRKLRDFCDQFFPEVLQPLDAARLIGRVNRAVVLLVGLMEEADSYEILSSYRGDFETSRKQIEVLDKYRQLLESLHSLELRLDAIEDTIFRGINRVLVIYALDLTRLANDARNQILDLPTRELEEFWIDELDTCIVDMRGAFETKVAVADIENLREVPLRLRAILGHRLRLNDALVNAAKALRLDTFAETFDTIVQRIGSRDQGGSVLRPLAAGSAAVGMLRSVLAGTVAQYDEWRWFQTEPDLANISLKLWPKVPNWKRFEAKLLGVLDIYPEADWSRDLRATMGECKAATPSVERNNAERIERTFGMLHAEISYRWYVVNKELNALTATITQSALPVETLLAAMNSF
jgi:hypothetical protein